MKLGDLVFLEREHPRIFIEVKKLLKVAEAAKRTTEWGEGETALAVARTVLRDVLKELEGVE